MGLIRAGAGALGGTLADQWKEFFYCDSLSANTLMTKGQKRTGNRSSNTKGSDNVISNGSGIVVNDGQCMIIVEQGKIVEVCAEPGQFTYNSQLEPSIFTGKLSTSIKETFKQVGKRFTFGGDTGKDQRVYYFNTKEILDNKFGTPNPFMFDVVNKQVGFRRTVQVRCNGIYTYRITDPILFYTNIAGNVGDSYERTEIDGTLKAAFIDALQPAFAELTELELRPTQIPAHTKELKSAINNALSEWTDRRGITIESVSLNPITLTEEDMKKINQLEDAASLGANPFMMAGRMTDSTANAMETAAGNANGAMNGLFGMGMVGGGMAAGGFNTAQNLYNTGVQQQMANAAAGGWQCSCGATATGNFCPNCGKQKPAPATGWKCACGATATGNFCPNCGAKKPENNSWTCACGTVNEGRFCSNCGAQKPSANPVYQCNKCGWKPEDPHNPPRFCPECGDVFDANDAK